MSNYIYPIEILNNGGVIAYPTEAVYGLGCDPYNDMAIQRLLDIKQRPADKGLILIAATWEQLQPFLQPLAPALMASLMVSWPGPVTWLVPAAETTSRLLTGAHQTLAVRITAHPIAAALCKQFGKPLVSTSANRSSESPCRSAEEVAAVFKNDIDAIVTGAVGSLEQPTEIRDLLSGQRIR